MRKGIYCTLLSILLCAAVFVLPILNPGTARSENDTDDVKKSPNKITDNSEPTSAPEINTPKSDETVTFIIEVDGDSFCDTVLASAGKYKSIAEFINSKDIRQYNDAVKKSQAVVKAGIRKIIPDISLDNCYNYNTIFNGFSVTAPYSSLEKLKKISGVKSVTLASSHMMSISENEPESEAEDLADTAGTTDTVGTDSGTDGEATAFDNAEISDYTVPQDSMTGIESAYAEGYTGKGKVIAVIDDGFDCGHEAFSAQPTSGRYDKEFIDRLISSAGFNIAENTSPVVSDKLIYSYDYADMDNNTYREDSSHGTHMAALIAGNNGREDENLFRSGAYDAQLILMKVCSDGSKKVGDDVFLAALDDAAKLSPDIINISLGVPRISTTAGIFTRVTNSLSQLGISVISAAGNFSCNIADGDGEGINSKYMDYGTISYPAAAESVTAVGSADTETYISDYFITDKGERIEYRDIMTDGKSGYPVFSEDEYEEYIYTDSFGSEDELRIIDLTGKTAIVKRGEISVDEKIKTAEKKGAVGIIIISDEPLYINLTASERTIPAAAVSSGAEKYFSENPVGRIKSSGSKSIFTAENGGKPSDFTSYGVTSDLILKPDFLAPGTDIYSAVSDGYNALSGTSVSSALTSGAAALVSEYAENSLPGISGNDLKLAYNALMMNTAERIKYSDSLYYTPRLQGAGVMNVENALDSSAYVLSENGSGGVSMGDSDIGEYSFMLKLTSLSDVDTTYKPNFVIQTDKIIREDGEYRNTLLPEDISEYADVSFFVGDEEIKDITLPAYGSVEVNVKIKLSPAVVLLYTEKAENGFYADGFIEFTPTDNSSQLSIPFTGYCGIWELADIFDASVYSENERPVISGNSLMGVAADGSSYPGIVLGKNMTTGDYDGDNICIGKDTVKNVYDSASAGISFVIPNFYLLRDAADYTISISNKTGGNIFTGNIGTVSSFASGGYEPYAELLSSFNSDGLKNLFSSIAEGEYVYTVSARAIPAAGGKADTQSVSYPFTVDNTKPDKPVTRTYYENEKIYLETQSEDLNGVQGFILYTAAKSGDKYAYADKIDDLISSELMDEDSYSLVRTETEGNKTKFIYDITQLYTQLIKVKSHSDFTDNEMLDQTKIVVRAVDSAYNLSDPVTADSMVNTKVIYKLTDQNGKPVRGVKISVAGITAESDESGLAVFDKIIPDYYAVSIIEVPENYTAEYMNGALFLTKKDTEYEVSIKFNFTGEYPPEEISGNEEESVKPENENKKEPDEPDISFENDNSSFALVFVAILLIISMATLTIRRKRTKQEN